MAVSMAIPAMAMPAMMILGLRRDHCSRQHQAGDKKHKRTLEIHGLSKAGPGTAAD